MIAVRAIDADSGDHGSRIKVWRDERTQLRSLMVWVEFVVNLFPDELCRLILAFVKKQRFVVNMPSRTSSRVIIPSGMIAGSNICKNYKQDVNF